MKKKKRVQNIRHAYVIRIREHVHTNVYITFKPNVYIILNKYSYIIYFRYVKTIIYSNANY